MSESSHKNSFLQENGFLLLPAFIKLVFHLSVNAFTAYGYFRDEFYYLACSEHLDWGYVDHPPLSILLLSLSRLILGDSLIAIRFLPALAGAATVSLAGILARELGGQRWSQVLASITAFAAPILLGMNSIYSMNSFDFLFWSLAALLMVRIIKHEKSADWIALGTVLGLGLMNKVGVLWLGAGIAVGLLVTGQRSWLKTRWPWIAGGLAMVVFLPYVAWNAANDFAHLEFIRNATSQKYSSLNTARFVTDQILLQNPASLPVWLGGLWYFFFSESGKRFRILGVMYLTAFGILAINQHSKAEYLAPAYPMLFAGGAVWMESTFASRIPRAKHAIPAIIAGFGMIVAPMAAPVLPVERYIAYAEWLGIKPSTAENKRLAELPQFYADMFGWEELAATVVSVYENLPAGDREHAVIYTQNYGEAGSISFFGKKFGLPRVVSGHNNYYLWGPGTDSIETVIIVGGDREDHLQAFESVELAARSSCRYCMPYENDLPIFVARKIKRPIREIWPLTKNYS